VAVTINSQLVLTCACALLTALNKQPMTSAYTKSADCAKMSQNVDLM